MEFDEIIVKESPGLCRCCLSEGCYKDLGSEYTWMNETEVYADMLLECFDIGISQHNDGPNGPNRLICEVCITRLRDACNFKKQVLDSEKKFVDMVGRGEFRPKVMVYQAMMKAETLPEEALVEDGEVEYLDEIFEEEPLKSDDVAPEASVSDDISLAALAKGKRGRPKKNSVKSEKKVKVAKLDDKPKTSRTVTRDNRERGLQAYKETVADEPEYTHKTKTHTNVKIEIMRQNVVQVLLKSTVMPFRWLKSSFRCFYCYDMFREPKDLKAHNDTHKDDLEKCEAMNKYWEPVVYVDVSNLSCKLCPVNIKDLYELIDHLIAVHDVQFNKDIGICINPFKLNNISVDCLECGSNFRTFGHLLIHTNKNHKSCGTAILCELCGQYFRNIHALRDHTSKEHESKAFKCPQCDVVIKNSYYLRTHMQNFHNKRYKCKMCSETFQTHYKRAQHIMTTHNCKDFVKCPHCPRTFVFRSAMMRHFRETHLQEKNAMCPVCGWRSFDIHRLQRHLMKHCNERHVKCPLCDKAFKTRKTMRQHCQNIHDKDKGPGANKVDT